MDQSFNDEQPCTVEVKVKAKAVTWENRVVCGTDGACSNQSYPKIARAGCGVSFGVAHPANRSYPLKGACQTAQRAEAHAMLTAMRTSWMETLILTDSAFVVTCIHKIRNGCDPARMEHSDIWHEVKLVMDNRPWDWFMIRKVKAHRKI